MTFPLLPDIEATVADAFMRRALELGRRGRGRTSPNPPVGAVVVRGDRIVGEGFHPKAGQPHAEVFALADAGPAAQGADLYVTLEPCAHHGKTPPCTDAIIAAGITRVIIGMPDPTAEASGGARVLADAGIAVEFAPDPSPFEALTEGWRTRLATGRPFVTAKIALTLDGHAAFEESQPASISGAQGAEYTRALRSRVDAVLVGAATVIADDPRLTVRDPKGMPAEEQPLRVVLVRDRVPSPDAAVFADRTAPTLVLASDAAPADGLSYLPEHVLVDRFHDSDALKGAFAALGRRGLNDLLVEPGPTLLTAMWDDALFDELVAVYAAGMAGASAPALFLGPADRTDDALAPRLTAHHAEVSGQIAVVTWRPDPSATNASQPSTSRS
ncbi:MAG: bifunctional diaminohydroxyphosphoribosylaminopyrimidine deaminase/5-amino-6-(5-phosphoribosylamino)uracil reductase RibD [Coriobacteriales bacterium]|nr:bifunctional diaminohydroxyphosphoribosylaminopyrimidine deaminase/5-amino-6-(5-phosphoribosylamino)uracil reductase RibD [Coriobacteriales bacterium]